MNDIALTNIDTAAHFAGKNLQHRGFTPEALHLQNFLQLDASHHSAKTVLRGRAGEQFEGVENRGKPLGLDQFFQKERCAAFETEPAFFFSRIARENDYLLTRVRPAQ